MDVLLHFTKPKPEAVKETERVYRSVGEYDAVLRSHCGLDGAEAHGDGSDRQF
jgi:hypothetical protein